MNNFGSLSNAEDIINEANGLPPTPAPSASSSKIVSDSLESVEQKAATLESDENGTTVETDTTTSAPEVAVGATTSVAASAELKSAMTKAIATKPGLPEIVVPPVPPTPPVPLVSDPLPKIDIPTEMPEEAEAIEKGVSEEITEPLPEVSTDLTEEVKQAREGTILSVEKIEECEEKREKMASSLSPLLEIIKIIAYDDYEPGAVTKGWFSQTRTRSLMAQLNSQEGPTQDFDEAKRPLESSRGTIERIGEGAKQGSYQIRVPDLANDLGKDKYKLDLGYVGFRTLEKGIEFSIQQILTTVSCDQLEQYEQAVQLASSMPMVFQRIRSMLSEQLKYYDPDEDRLPLFQTVLVFLGWWFNVNQFWLSFPEVARQIAEEDSGSMVRITENDIRKE